MSAARSPHLQAMGIQQWVRREAPQQERVVVESQPGAVAESAPVDYGAQIECQGAVGAALMLITPPLEPAAEQLLTAMLRAIGLAPEQCYRLTVQRPELLTEGGFYPFLQQQIAYSRSQLQLQLGGEERASVTLFTTFNPTHLLHHPADKRAAWEVLKQLRSKLSQ